MENITISTSNVLTESEFKKRVEDVFNFVSEVITKTLGPFGQTTIIEEFGEMHVTKDGHTVLKNITFTDNIDNNILYMLKKIAGQVVTKVGDGTSTSIVATNEILKEFKESNILSADFGPRDFIASLNKIANILTNDILNNATPVGTTDFNEDRDKTIHSLAMVSTNGNKEISEMISRIYAETKNPTIAYVKNSYSNHECQIINGYLSDIRLLDGIYVSDQSGQRIVKQPLFLMFDSRVDLEHVEHIVRMATIEALDSGRMLVVIAPYYSEDALRYIRENTVNYFKRTNGQFQNIFTKVSIINNNQREMYQDLSTILGATIIDSDKASKYINSVKDNSFDIKELMNCVGMCETVTVKNDSALFEGLYNINQQLYDVTMNDAISRFNTMRIKQERLEINTPDYFNLKQRIAKLKCHMGIIKVGGISTLEQVANMDLVDDAVKGCENAFIYGYNVGCSMAVPLSITKLLADLDNDFTESETKILLILNRAFTNVYAKIISNKFTGNDSVTADEISEKIENVIITSYGCGLPVDLTTNQPSDKIINPCCTDTEVLKASISIVSLLLTSNQYLKIQLPDMH